MKTLAKGSFKKFKDIFAVKTDDLEKTKLLPHRINLESGTVPIKQKPYRLSRIQLKALKEIIKMLTKNRLIEPSDSPWSSPLVLVPKKYNQYRM